jgi:ribosome-associated translation inhibitor RaiA
MTAGSRTVKVQLTVRGDIPEEDQAYALSKIEHVLHLTNRPIIKAHLVLSWESGAVHPQPARLGVGIDVNGMPVRAHIEAETVREGADLLQARLGRRLVELQDRSRDRHR